LTPTDRSDNVVRGYLVPIGGAERKVKNPEILRRFVAICGGSRARVAVIPTASEAADTGRRYERVFRKLGVGSVRILEIRTRAECESEGYLREIDRVDGIFLTGGNQVRLSTTLGGTEVAERIRIRNAEGVHVAGTSAGAAFFPEHMIAGGASGSTPRADMVQLAPGLGLTNHFIIDQHFRQRDRLGRLLAALAYNPMAVGLGLDEDTAAFIGPDDSFEVVGSGGITIVDPSGLEHSTMDSANGDSPVSLIGLRLHVLANGGVYDVERRTAYLAAPEGEALGEEGRA
jgi:cyanophycinase